MTCLQLPASRKVGAVNSLISRAMRPRIIFAAGFLILVRGVLGKMLELDAPANPLPIPGSLHRSVGERLSEGDLEENLSHGFTSGGRGDGHTGFRMVYLFEREALWEISTKPAHALMHLGWVRMENGFYTARLAVYARPRGFSGRMYLALIMPFRRHIVYPVMMEVVESRWRQAVSGLKNRTGGEK